MKEIENTYFEEIISSGFATSARGVYDLFIVLWSDMGVAEWSY